MKLLMTTAMSRACSIENVAVLPLRIVFSMSVIPFQNVIIIPNHWRDDYATPDYFSRKEEDDQVATAIFTHDGTYPEAKVISMDGAEPITSEDDLLGKWKMTAMNFMGVSIYGSSEALENMSGSTEMTITFKEGGVASMETSDGTWEIGNNGATLTSNDVTGTHTYPIKKLGDDIVIDMSESLGGTEFITLMSKAK